MSWCATPPEQIALQFSQAAKRYDSLALVQKEIAADLRQLLVDQHFNCLLDIGCGTGRVTQQLSAMANQVIGLDLSFGMLRYAQNQPPQVTGSIENIRWLNADADNLPFSNNSIDAVFSSMAIQWSKNIERCFAELFRVCRADARIVLAIMSNGSLYELANAWQILDKQQHINSFHDTDYLFQQAQKCGFSGKVSENQYTTWHSDVSGAMHSIKDIGAKKSTSTGTVVSLTKSRLNRLQQRYAELYEQAGQLPLTYNVTFLELFK